MKKSGNILIVDDNRGVVRILKAVRQNGIYSCGRQRTESPATPADFLQPQCLYADTAL